MYSKLGRPSIAPEQMLRALLLLQMLYSVRSERMLVTAQMRKTRHRGHFQPHEMESSRNGL